MTPRKIMMALGLFSTALMAFPSAARASEMATVTLVGTPAAGGGYSYNATVNDTGTTPIGTFWFSWVPGAGFLTAVPTGVQSPAGWTERATNAGAAIQWTTTTNLLSAGSSLGGFSFLSTEAPAQLTMPVTVVTAGGVSLTEPGSVFFVYQGAPLAAGDPGFKGVASVVATPEPSSLLLVFTGLSGVATVARRRWQGRRTACV